MIIIFKNLIKNFPVSPGTYEILSKILNKLNKNNYINIFIRYWLKFFKNLKENRNHIKSENFFFFFLIYLGTKNLILYYRNGKFFDFIIYFIIKNYETSLKNNFELDVISRLFRNFLNGTFFCLTFINVMVSKIIKTAIIRKNSSLNKLFSILYRFQRSGNHRDFLFFIFFKITLQKIRKIQTFSLINVLKLNWFSLGIMIRTFKKISFALFLRKKKRAFFKQKFFFDFGISKYVNFKKESQNLKEDTWYLFINNKKRMNFFFFYLYFLIVPGFDKSFKQKLKKEKNFLTIGPAKIFQIKTHKRNNFFVTNLQIFKRKINKNHLVKFLFIQKSKIIWLCLEKIQSNDTEKFFVLIFFLLKKSKCIQKLIKIFYLYLQSILGKKFFFKILNSINKYKNKLIVLCGSFYFSKTFSRIFQKRFFNVLKKNLYFYEKIKKKSQKIFLIKKVLKNVKNLSWLNFVDFFTNWLILLISMNIVDMEEVKFSKKRNSFIITPQCKNCKGTMRWLVALKLLNQKIYLDIILKKIYDKKYSKNPLSGFLKTYNKKYKANVKNKFLKIFYKNIKSQRRSIFQIKKIFYIWYFFLATNKNLKNFNKWLKKIYSKISTKGNVIRKSKKMFHKIFFLILDFNTENLFYIVVSEMCNIFLNFCMSNFLIHLRFTTKKFIFKEKHLEQYKNFLGAFILALFSSFNFYMINFLEKVSIKNLLLCVKTKLKFRFQSFKNLKLKIIKFSYQKIKCPLKAFY